MTSALKIVLDNIFLKNNFTLEKFFIIMYVIMLTINENKIILIIK